MEQRWAAEAKISELIEAHPLLGNDEGAVHREALEANSLSELKARLDRIDDEVREKEQQLGETQLGTWRPRAPA